MIVAYRNLHASSKTSCSLRRECLNVPRIQPHGSSRCQSLEIGQHLAAAEVIETAAQARVTLSFDCPPRSLNCSLKQYSETLRDPNVVIDGRSDRDKALVTLEFLLARVDLVCLCVNRNRNIKDTS